MIIAVTSPQEGLYIKFLKDFYFKGIGFFPALTQVTLVEKKKVCKIIPRFVAAGFCVVVSLFSTFRFLISVVSFKEVMSCFANQ